MKKIISSSLDSKQKAASEWLKRMKEDLELKSWLNKAQNYEKNNDFQRALDSYLSFLDLKLNLMKSRSEYNLESYLKLAPYYIKIGDCYKNIRHYKPEDRLRDFSKAAEYYTKAASMYLELKEYTSANVYFEFASKTYAEVELYDKAAEAYKNIAEMYMKLGNTLIASMSYSKVGELYEKAGLYDQSYDCYTRAAQLFSSIGDVNSASQNFRKAAEVLRKQGKYEDAIKHYVDAAKLGTQIERYSDVAKTYLGIAQNYEETGKLEEAVRYYLKAAENIVDTDESSAAEAFKNAARCFFTLKKYPDAIQYYRRSAELSSRIGNHIAAAEGYWRMAECSLILKEYANAAEYYIKAARSGMADPKKGGMDYLKGFQKSAELYSKLAEECTKENRLSEAIRFYKEAGKSLVSIKAPSMAGEMYLRAGLLEKATGTGDVYSTCSQAAELFREAGLFSNSGECYREINEFIKASQEFITYAEQELSKEKLFSAAEGYKKAGECYAELGQKEAMTNNYNKANQTYLKYVEKLKMLGVTEDKESNIGEAYFGLGESNKALNNLLNAVEYFKNALDHFSQRGLQDKAILSDAFFSLLSAKLSIQQGNYAMANELLSKAIDKFEKALESDKWSARYKKILESNLKEAKNTQAEISEKPELTLVLDRSPLSFVNVTLPINILITNNSNQAVSKITFLTHLPEGFDVLKQPSLVEELAPKQSIKSVVKVVSKRSGQFKLKPMEVLYEDKRGIKYMKSSNIVSIEIFEKPVVEYKNYMDAVELYQRYADNHMEFKNFFYAAEGYKSAAECFKEFTFRRSADVAKMRGYYQKAADAYLKYIEELKASPESVEQMRLIADSDFNLCDCYDNLGEIKRAEEKLNEAVELYNKILNTTKNEKERIIAKAQLDVLNSFSLRLKGKTAAEEGNIDEARRLLEESIHSLDESISKGWDKEYEDFLKRVMKETKEYMNSLKIRPIKSEKKVAEKIESSTKVETESVSEAALMQLFSEKEQIEKNLDEAIKRYYNKQPNEDEEAIRNSIEEYERQLNDVDLRIERMKSKLGIT